MMKESRKKRLLVFIALLAAVALCALQSWAQAPALTQIQDTLFLPNGAENTGTITISNPTTFTSADGFVVAANTQVVTTVTNGAVNVSLVPNAGSSPTGTYYVANYNINGAKFTEYWVVPSSGSAIKLSSVRALAPPAVGITVAFSQINPPAGCLTNQLPQWRNPGWGCINSSGTGTVTSVGLSMPAWFSVANSPVTTSGTLAVTAAGSQTSHQVIGTCGSATSFSPCSLTGSDLPNPSATTIGGVESIAVVTHNFLTGISTSGVPSAAQPAFSDLSGSIATSQVPAGTGCSANQYANALNASLALGCAQVAYSQLSGTPLSVTNDTTTGTTVNTLTKINSSANAIIASTTDTAIPVFIATAGAGKSGSVSLAVFGTANCVFDGATTADHFVVASSTTGGDCHDAGATAPSSGWVIGQVTTTNATGGTYAVLLSQGYNAAAGGGGPTLQTNGVSNASQTTLNFITSTTNSIGGTITPANSTSTEKFELTGTINPTGGGTGLSNPTAHSLFIAEGSVNNGLLTSPTTNGQCTVVFNVTASAAVDPTCPLEGVGYNPQSGAYTIAYSDRFSDIPFTGSVGATFTIPLHTTAGFGSNFAFLAPNTGTANLTLAATSTDTIDGGASATVFPQWNAGVYEDNSNNFHTQQSPLFAAFPNCSTMLTFTTSTGVFGCPAAVNATQVNGGTVPASALVLGSNSSNQPISATAANVATLIQGLTGCNTASNVFTPQASDCVAQSASAPTIAVANAGTTGTTVNTLTKLTGAPSTAIITATSDTAGAVGVCTSGCGTTGTATITYAGSVSLVIDNATTAGDYVVFSSATAGNGHDAGSSYPTSGQVVGRVLSTNAAGGTFTVDLYPSEIKAATGGGTAGTVTYTTNTTASTADNNKLVRMNCSSACAYTLPNPQPATVWNVVVESVGGTPATIALGSSMTYNGAASVPTLNNFRLYPIWANTATSTDYDGMPQLSFGSGFGTSFSSNASVITANVNGGGTPASTTTNFGVAISTTTSFTSGNVSNPEVTLVGITVSQITLGVACGAGSNTVSVTLGWTGVGGNAETQTFSNVLSISANGAVDSSGSAMTTIPAKFGTAVTYATTSTLASTGCTTTPQYAVGVKGVW